MPIEINIHQKFFIRVQEGAQIEIFFHKTLGNEKYFFRLRPHPQGTIRGVLVASCGICILIMTLLNHRNTATTKKLDFKINI